MELRAKHPVAAAMNAVSAAQEQRKRVRTRHVDVAPDMMKEILQNLPHQIPNSLLRRLTIMELHDFRPNLHPETQAPRRPPNVGRDPLLDGLTRRRLRLSHRGFDRSNLHAFCDEFCLVQVGESIYLWNLPMRMYRKLSDPLLMPI